MTFTLEAGKQARLDSARPGAGSAEPAHPQQLFLDLTGPGY